MKSKSKLVISLTLTIVMATLCIFFGVNALLSINDGIFYTYRVLSLSLLVFLITLITALSILFLYLKKDSIYKLGQLTIFLLAFVLCFAYFIVKYNLYDRFNSIEEIREFVASKGKYSVPIFIIVQFLQVVAIPLLGMLTIGAGVALFGPFYGAILSIIGIFVGSLLAFFIGKVLGYKVAAWIVGEETLDKWLDRIKGKDKLLLTAMFILPFFPDDVLCFVAGLSTMSWQFFTIMTFITRVITVFACSYSLNGSIIPFNTWWGLTLWAVVIVAVVVGMILLYKHGEKLQNWFAEKFKKRDKSNGRKKTSR